MRIAHFFCILLGTAIVSDIVGCGSAQTYYDESLRGRFEYAKSLFEQKDYYAAQLEFNKLTYLSRATEYEDDVQFYLAQSYFFYEQYLLAADAYQTLLRNTPSSPYSRIAFFQIAMCYYKLAPIHSLDQEYSKRAIAQFQSYIDTYPAPDSEKVTKEIRDLRLLAAEVEDSARRATYEALIARLVAQLGQLDTLRLAEEKIMECRNKLALKALESARQYIQLRAFRAATIYFDEILTNYPDSPYYEEALLGKIETLVVREKWSEAESEIEKYEEKFPEKKYKVEGFKAVVKEQLLQSTQTTAK
ncbi:MAG: outer membrane protein assembly factor BamD [Chloroherpetonaceae bacterium]|nr:outer membrane protein assembly factor BamD [Chloroherpetonaceae bacterium]